jgi:hypothetical protein
VCGVNILLIPKHTLTCGRYFCSKPISVIVGESKQTFYVHQQVLTKSPVLKKMCDVKYVKETASIELPDDDPGIFEYVLGYLYFEDYNPPAHALRWECHRLGNAEYSE